MKTLESDKIVCFDVDDTLITQDFHEEGVEVVVECNGYKTDVLIINNNIDSLKKHKRQGQTVIVWSAAGHKWAESVVKALNLEKYVDYVMSKPNWYYDDLPCEKWMGKPRWGRDRK